MVANFAYAICIRRLISISPMLGLFWETNQSIYLNSVEFKLIDSVFDTLIQRP